MKTIPTYWANIYVGLKEGYSGPCHVYCEIYDICQSYVDEVGLGLTVTETQFFYTNGREPGVIVGLINYPRFPSSTRKLRAHALVLARILKKELRQERVTVVFPDETVLLGKV